MDTIETIVRVLTFQGYFHRKDTIEEIEEITYWVNLKDQKYKEYRMTEDGFDEAAYRANREVVKEILSNSANWLDKQ